MHYFKDRQHAGIQLAGLLTHYRGPDTVVCAIPRGGVVLGVAVVQLLQAPFDLLVSRKIGHPYNTEYAIGAVTEYGDVIFEEHEISHVNPAWLAQTVARERQEARRRRKVYWGNQKRAAVAGKVVIIVDDGLATGLTMKAAVLSLQKQKPKKIVVAVPIASRAAIVELKKLVDEVVASHVPSSSLAAIGSYYTHFDQVSDSMVGSLIQDMGSHAR